MKLRMITECSRPPIQEGYWTNTSKEHADSISMRQAVQNLTYSTLTKLRNMLDAMGLIQGGKQLNRVPTPIHQAISVFATLRTAVQERLKGDTETIIHYGLQSPAAQRIVRFWGFTFPRDWSDVTTGQAGRWTADGEFDDLLRQAVAQSANQPPEAKIQVLANLVHAIRLRA